MDRKEELDYYLDNNIIFIHGLVCPLPVQAMLFKLKQELKNSTSANATQIH